MAKDLFMSISGNIVNDKNGVATIVSALHERDPLTVVSMVYGELHRLMSTERRINESFCDVGLYFYAQLSHFNSLAARAALTD